MSNSIHGRLISWRLVLLCGVERPVVEYLTRRYIIYISDFRNRFPELEIEEIVKLDRNSRDVKIDKASIEKIKLQFSFSESH